MSKLIYRREYVKDIKHEVQHLLDNHWEEIAMYKDKIKLKPDWDKYIMLDQSDTLVCLTARDEGTLVGYYVAFVVPHMHYSDHLFALNDILFIHPSYRKGRNGIGLFLYAEKYLKNIGVSVMTMHMKTSNPFDKLCEKLGWDYAERLYTKYIGE